MINFKKYLLITIIISFSCSKEDNLSVVWVSQYNLFAPDSIISNNITTKKYIKYSLSEEDTVSHDKWDIAFKGVKLLLMVDLKLAMMNRKEPVLEEFI